MTSLRAAPPAPRLAKPTFARVKAVSLFEIDLTWRDHSSHEDGFQIERSTDRVHFRQIAQVLPGTTIYRDQNRFPGTRYYYRIRAFNSSGNSGYSTASARTPTPARPLTIVTWGTTFPVGTNTLDCVAISEGTDAVLELHKNGTVTAIEKDSFGEAQPPADLSDVVAISAGIHHYMALKSDGTVVHWGSLPLPSSPPTNLTGVVAIAAGGQHCLALKGDGTVVGWGNTLFGQETPPADLRGVVAIAAGIEHSLALKSDGSVVSWGGDLRYRTTPLPDTHSAMAIAAGFERSFVVQEDGTVLAWGDNQSGAGIPPTNLTGVVSISAALDHTEALKKDGTVVFWGTRSFNYSPFRQPDLGGGVLAISTLGDETAVLSLSPASPSHLWAKVLTAKRIDLTWQDNSSGESSFQLERCVNGSSLVWRHVANLPPDVTNYTDNGIAPNVVYRYRVRAINPFGKSPFSQQDAVTTEPLVAPSISLPSLGSNDVIVEGFDNIWDNFSNPAYFSGMDGFRIERAPDVNGAPGSWSELGSSPALTDDPYSELFFGTAFSFHDTNAAANATYWYRVRAFNVLGFSDYSDPVSFAVSLPSMPQAFSVQVVADQARLFWQPSYRPLTAGVQIERAPDLNGTPGSWNEITNLGPAADHYTNSGLPVDTTWWYRMRAFNWVGESAYTEATNATILRPAAPTLWSLYLGATNTVQMNWYESVLGAEGSQLERANDLGGQPGDWTLLHVSHVGDDSPNSFIDTNIVASVTYWYRVKDFNVLGESDYSLPMSISIAPPPVTPLNGYVFGNDVELVWSREVNGILGYRIERAPDFLGTPGQWSQIALLQPDLYTTPTSYSDTGLPPDISFWYRILSYNWVGDSDYSAPISVTTSGL